MVLKEQVGLARWAAVAAGLAGVVLILRPGAAAFDPGAAWALAAATFVALRDLHRLGRAAPTARDWAVWAGGLHRNPTWHALSVRQAAAVGRWRSSRSAVALRLGMNRRNDCRGLMGSLDASSNAAPDTLTFHHDCRAGRLLFQLFLWLLMASRNRWTTRSVSASKDFAPPTRPVCFELHAYRQLGMISRAGGAWVTSLVFSRRSGRQWSSARARGKGLSGFWGPAWECGPPRSAMRQAPQPNATPQRTRSELPMAFAEIRWRQAVTVLAIVVWAAKKGWAGPSGRKPCIFLSRRRTSIREHSARWASSTSWCRPVVGPGRP